MLIQLLLTAFLFARTLKGEDMYSSVERLANAFKIERKMADSLTDYLTKTEKQLEDIRRYLRDYEQVEEESKLIRNNSPTPLTEHEMAEILAGNPLQAFNLIKRLSIGWETLRDQNPFSDWQDVENVLEREENLDYSQIRNHEELKGTAQAIIMLQSMYRLNISSLVSGNIDGIQTSAELTAQDCLYLGRYSLHLEMYYNAILWLEQAFKLAGSEIDSTITQDQVLPFLTKAYQSYGDVGNLQPEFVSKMMSTTIETINNISKGRFRLGEALNVLDAHRNYEALCRGEQLLTDEEISKLKCYYDNRNSSYLVLMPAKVERHLVEPEILVFHDVINDNEIFALKYLANLELSRGLVSGTSRKEEGETTQARISKIAWIDEEVEKTFFKNMGLRINALTGLSTTDLGSSEPLQVANYGVGGLYNPHLDFLNVNEILEFVDEEEEKSIMVGDRIATFMFYLSHVNRGGATAFPRLGVSLFPEKGSAAFWYNMKKSGRGDFRSLHGGCPVIHGSKWVANKWIKEYNQMSKRPCALSQEK